MRQAERVLPVRHGVPADVATGKIAVFDGDEHLGRADGHAGEDLNEAPRSEGRPAALEDAGMCCAQTDDQVRSRPVAV